MTVVRATPPGGGTSVVLKGPSMEFPGSGVVARLRNEYDILKSLDVPAVVKAKGIELAGHRPILILENFDTDDLGAYLRTVETMDVALFLRFARAITSVLRDVHGARIIHKDIKPGNIVFFPNSAEVRLIDFDLATRLAEEWQPIENPGALEGTLAYVAPEQTGRMNRKIDYRTDFYSLGVVFYEALTGHPPFESPDALELVHCHIARMPPTVHELNPAVPKVISDIVMKLMAKTAEERYQSAHGLLHDLQICADQFEATGTVADFELGHNDASGILQIPERLYGREQEVQDLLAAFERASQGRSELLMVAGYPGVGKSALVSEIHKPVVENRGNFIAGKFDQYHANVPYSAVVQAFRGLMHQLLTEDDEKVGAWRKRIQVAVGDNGQVICDVIPEVELIIGEQPPAPVLGAAENQNRFNTVFQKFVAVFSREESPLALFLDDLQWADAASLDFLENIITDPNSKHLLLVGSYRDNEVDAGHGLSAVLDEIRKADIEVQTLRLEPLGEASVRTLLVDTLQADDEAVEDLVKLVLAKTDGNPFFLNQLLREVHRKGYLSFTHDEQRWTWDRAGIEGMSSCKNVVDLMVGRIKQLPEGTQSILQLAAFIGNHFDLGTLSLLAERSFRETASDLWEAVNRGLAVPTTGGYRLIQSLGMGGVEFDEDVADSELSDIRFLHDRVQQAAYGTSVEDERGAIHLRFGRILLEKLSDEQQAERLFDIVNHFNLADELIDDPAERIRCAELNLKAGAKAKLSAAYHGATAYLRSAMKMLPDTAWQEHYELCFQIHLELAECEYLSGKFEQAEALYAVANANAATPLNKVRVYLIERDQYQFQGRYADAIRVQRAGLAVLGFELPEDDDGEAALLDTELALVEKNLAGRKIADLYDAPKISDPKLIAELELLVGLWVAAYLLSDDRTSSIASVRMTNLSLVHGNNAITAFAYVNYAILAGPIFGQYQRSDEFGKLALRLADYFDNVSIRCKVNHIWAGFINFWNHPLKESNSFYEKAWELEWVSGDFVYMGYTIVLYGADLIIQGKNLDEVRVKFENYMEVLRRTKNAFMIDIGYAGILQPLLNLKGETEGRFSFDGEGFSEDAYVKGYGAFPLFLAWFYYAKIRAAFLFDDRENRLELAEKAHVVAQGIPGQARVFEAAFFAALIWADAASTSEGDERDEHLHKAEEMLGWLEAWAANCEENFLHKVQLVKAELARARAQTIEAMDLYDLAIESARKADYVQNEALANELAGKFWISLGKDHIGKIHIQHACYGYSQWGATDKVAFLDEQYRL